MKLTYGVPAIFLMAVLAVTSISMLTALTTEAVNQAQAQSLAVTEQKSYVSDINVHFKTACFSIIVFTYCW